MYVCIYLLIHSSFFLLNVVFPTHRPNLAKVSHTKKNVKLVNINPLTQRKIPGDMNPSKT
jgi:hypothetical protein